MENRFDLIEKYLMNDMSVGEQKEFERLLSTDTDLKKEFLLRKEINDAILEDDIIDLRNSLEEITEKDKKHNLYLFTQNRRKFLSIAATIIILISISASFLFPFRKSSNQLFLSYYNAYPALTNIRSSENSNESEINLKKAFSFYENSDYIQASDYFFKVLNMDSNNSMAQFYLSVCEFENNNLIVSEEYLMDLILKKDHIFWEQAHWYLAMVYLKQDKTENAKSVLVDITKENMVYKTEAKRIIRLLH
ncbi:MAG: hypothetical protein KOO66_00680 [Bacteroidales bacterium]|nr:hypothetical protein [Bacteroidales bacterium]